MILIGFRKRILRNAALNMIQLKLKFKDTNVLNCAFVYKIILNNISSKKITCSLFVCALLN